MKYCRKCGAQINDSARFCPKCGAECPDAKKKKRNVIIAVVISALILFSGSTLITFNIIPKISFFSNPFRNVNNSINRFVKIFRNADDFTDSIKDILNNPGNDFAELDGLDADTIEQLNEAYLSPEEIMALSHMETDISAAEPDYAFFEPSEFEPEEPVLPETDVPESELPESEKFEGADIIPQDFSGYWLGYGGRFGVNIIPQGEDYLIYLEGSNSYRSGVYEYATCSSDGESLYYENGVQEDYIIDEYGKQATIIEFDNGKGDLMIVGPEFDLDSVYESDVEVSVFAREWDEGNGDMVSKDGNYLLWYSQNPEYENWACNQYMIWYSSELYLNEEDLFIMNADDLAIARNEIYARHGRKFTTDKIQQYFNSKPWYKGTIEADQFDDETMLSEIEKANIEFITEYERQLKE